jgi:hypothetical protein
MTGNRHGNRRPAPTREPRRNHHGTTRGTATEPPEPVTGNFPPTRSGGKFPDHGDRQRARDRAAQAIETEGFE